MRLRTKVLIVIAAGLVGYTVTILAYIGWFAWLAGLQTGSTSGPAIGSGFQGIIISPASYPLTFVVGVVVAIIAAAVVWRK